MFGHLRVSLVVSFLATAFVLSACSDDSVVQTGTGGEQDVSGGGVSVSFTKPQAGQVFQTSGAAVDIEAEVRVLGLELATDGPSVALSLDGAEVTTLTEARPYTYKGVPIGTHTLGVQALKADGTPYDGGEYRDEISIEVVAETTSECGTDADCASKANGTCQTATCDLETHTCQVVDEPTTTTCDDGDACTEDDHCDGGACVGGKPKVCNDDNECTDDSCEPASGCVFTNNTATCDDGDACTEGDVCADGACQPGVDACGECEVDGDCADKEDGDKCNGTFKCDAGTCVLDESTIPDCADPGICKVSACNPDTGMCEVSEAPEGTLCDDGDACTSGDSCQGGACLPADPVSCDDGDACTVDACNSETGTCTHEALPLECADDDLCTVESCDPATGDCVSTPTGLDCEDGNECTLGACDPATGACVQVNSEEACDDGSACTTGDVCKDGACVPGEAADCDDDDVCTDDSCDAATGECAHANNTADCDDGDACTSDDACDAGVCAAGTPKDCDDGEACTDDSCDPADGTCKLVANTATCDDGDACTSGDVCGGGSCKPGTAKDCDDKNPCTNDSCDPQTGTCTHTPNTAACDDGDVCTSGDACSAGKCLPGAIVPSCALPPESVCVVAGPAGTIVQCPFAVARFDAGTPLPATLNFDVLYDATKTKVAGFLDEICVGGNCFLAPVPPNNLQPSGHTLKLSPVSAAKWQGVISAQIVNLNDPTASLSSAFLTAGGSVSGDAVIVTMQIQTTTDVAVGAPVFVYLGNLTSWNIQGGPMNTWVEDSLVVVAPPNRCIPAAEVLCDDGDQCNGAETCDAATKTCMPGVSADCGDGNLDAACGEVCDDGNNDPGDGCNAECTSDESCGNGFQDPDEACDDGNNDAGDGCNADCTSNEECGNGFEDPDEECDDGNATGGDGCSPDCIIENLECVVDGDCDDNDVCTGIETCKAGTCMNGTPLDCDDTVACTVDTCDAVTGCANVPSDAACDDGNGCTVDVCDAASGCTMFVAGAGAPCEDGDPCTTGDSCSGIKCIAGPLADCDDGIPCTNDVCAPDGSCANLADNAACDDGDPCTANGCDAEIGCFEIPLSELPCTDDDPCTMDDQCLDGVCQPGGPHPGCGAPPGYVCDISGTVGEVVGCAVQLVRKAEAAPAATGIEFAMTYDPAKLELDNFYDDLCFEGFGCFESVLTGAGATGLSTGHQVSIAPTKTTQWAGDGAVVIVNTSDPTTPLTDAYLDGQGAVVGEPLLFTAKFKLLVDVNAAAPEKVELSELVSSDAVAATLVSEIINQIIETWAQ